MFQEDKIYEAIKKIQKKSQTPRRQNQHSFQKIPEVQNGSR